jgi:gluconate 2-dehydrogenase gamma chain
MADRSDEARTGLSRREWLRRAGWAGAAVAIAPAGQLIPAAALRVQTPQADAPETLTQTEADTLEAITARLIPTDENGPGAREARAARYIDRALGGALAASLADYRTGLAALDRHARQTKGAAFTALAPADQDAVLTDIERNAATDFTPSAGAFFALVRTHTLQGTFGDPHYGGNANFVGWDLIGYPGLRLVVGPDDQQLDAAPEPTRASAYDHDLFTSRPPRAAISKGSHHAG